MRLPKMITLLSVFVFAASLTQNAYYIAGENPKAWSPAFYSLLLGPIGLFAGIFEWLANPVLFAAWVFSFGGKNKIALLLGIVASALMLAFLFRHTHHCERSADLCENHRLRRGVLAFANERWARDSERRNRTSETKIGTIAPNAC